MPKALLGFGGARTRAGARSEHAAAEKCEARHPSPPAKRNHHERLRKESFCFRNSSISNIVCRVALAYIQSMHKNTSQAGFGHLMLMIVVVVVVAVVGFAAYRVMNAKDEAGANNPAATGNSQTLASAWPIDEEISWSSDGRGGWITMPYDAKPPACPDPLILDLPTPDFAEATSIAYPGQSRTGSFEGLGGNYKAHGGIRFQGHPDNNIEVVMPFNGSVVSATKDLVEGEYQYGFRIVNACGIMISFGHMHDLTPAFQAIADTLPDRAAGDSRSTPIEPAVAFKTGDKVATVVGLVNSKNVGFDYGVYDLRTNNEASKDEAYKAAHAETGETAFHGLCWLDNLNDEDKAAAKSLPGTDSVTGKTSDYCK